MPAESHLKQEELILTIYEVRKIGSFYCYDQYLHLLLHLCIFFVEIKSTNIKYNSTVCWYPYKQLDRFYHIFWMYNRNGEPAQQNFQ